MAGVPPPVALVANNAKDHYSAKPPVVYGKNDYLKDIIESLFLGHDVDLWDMVFDGDIHPIDYTS